MTNSLTVISSWCPHGDGKFAFQCFDADSFLLPSGLFVLIRGRMKQGFEAVFRSNFQLIVLRLMEAQRLLTGLVFITTENCTFFLYQVYPRRRAHIYLKIQKKKIKWSLKNLSIIRVTCFSAVFKLFTKSARFARWKIRIVRFKHIRNSPLWLS